MLLSSSCFIEVLELSRSTALISLEKFNLSAEVDSLGLMKYCILLVGYTEYLINITHTSHEFNCVNSLYTKHQAWSGSKLFDTDGFPVNKF